MSITTRHLLTIGATGMLADAVVSLADGAARVTSVARTRGSLDRLDRRLRLRRRSEGRSENRSPPHADHPIPHRMLPLDYREQEHFRDEVVEAIAGHPVDRAVVWMHGPIETSGVVDLARRLGRGEGTTEFWHVVGSGQRDLSVLVDEHHALFDEIEGLLYRRIILGYVVPGDSGPGDAAPDNAVERSGEKAAESFGEDFVENNRRRWLTDREISDGVVRCMEKGESGIVGKGDPLFRTLSELLSASSRSTDRSPRR